jgi:O-antigen/teichoic acid export membrane protein
VDAGLASLSSFLVGIYAVRTLDLTTLGFYSLLFSAFQIAAQISADLVFIPSQIIAASQPEGTQLGSASRSVPKGVVVAICASALVPIVTLPLVPSNGSGYLALSATAIAVTAVSPIQDHLRAVFHLAKKSWIAALMSGVHLLATGASLTAFHLWNENLAPFGALFVGNVLSLLVAAYWITRKRTAFPPKTRWRDLRSIGGWLLTTGLVKTGIGFAGRALLSTAAGLSVVGFVEGARVVAQPINVFALGLNSQIGPRLMRASSEGNRDLARTWRHRFLVLFATGAFPYVALVATDWSLNPLATLTPRAYEIPGLTVVMLIAVVLTCWLRPLRLELLGARKQRWIAGVTAAAGVLELGLVGLLLRAGSFSIPIGLIGGTLVAVVLFYRGLGSAYKEPHREPNEFDALNVVE